MNHNAKKIPSLKTTLDKLTLHNSDVRAPCAVVEKKITRGKTVCTQEHLKTNVYDKLGEDLEISNALEMAAACHWAFLVK